MRMECLKNLSLFCIFALTFTNCFWFFLLDSVQPTRSYPSDRWTTLGQLVLESIRILLLEIQDLGISKVARPFFPIGYDLSFLKSSANWKQISFKNLLQGMKVVVNGINVEFYSHLFPNQVVFQVPMRNHLLFFQKLLLLTPLKPWKMWLMPNKKRI